MNTGISNIDFDRLLKLRLVVARHGEMDGISVEDRKRIEQGFGSQGESNA